MTEENEKVMVDVFIPPSNTAFTLPLETEPE